MQTTYAKRRCEWEESNVGRFSAVRNKKEKGSFYTVGASRPHATAVDVLLTYTVTSEDAGPHENFTALTSRATRVRLREMTLLIGLTE